MNGVELNCRVSFYDYKHINDNNKATDETEQ